MSHSSLPPAAVDTSRMFLDAVVLTPVDSTEETIVSFEATPQYVPWPKAYGGDMVAQATKAMIATAGEDRVLHSTHSYFMRPVDMHVPVRYDVEILRDGRGYSTRQVRAHQNGKLAFISIGSFQVPEDGPVWQQPAAPQELSVDPESLATAAQALEGRDDAPAQYWSHGRSFDMRHVPGPVYMAGDDTADAEQAQQGHQAVWVRAFENFPDEPTQAATATLHQVGLAYLCDYTILEPILRARGLTWSTHGLVTASLDHSMWFHRAGRVDEWLLYVQDAHSAQSNRGLAVGRFFTRDGQLLATVAQEGMIRA